ncbi:glycosyltransferase family 4 protein [Streptomyces sp. NPDC051636]|uniref:glycosyltransferase family 4 protein n=1 Tax=Streptomyces sp. NPDC051636 TaxID=3365663 RepID=UPI0037B0168A
MTRQAQWFFAYTHGGAAHVARQGFPKDRITAVQNATDTAALRLAVDKVTESEVRDFSARYALLADRTALFVGRLDGPKRLHFLLTAVAHIAEALPGFTLLVAGDGPQRSLLESAAVQQRGVVYLGSVKREDLAVLGAVSRLMLMPGLVGLCAVDSFALGTPVVTTRWPYHSPEFEYLEHGRNAVVTENTPERYAEGIVGLLSNDKLMVQLGRECSADCEKYTVEAMSARFVEGLSRMLA